MLVSSVPDGVLYNPAGGLRQQYLKFSVISSTSDTARTVAFFDYGT